MGHERRTLTVSLTLDNHGGDKQARDERLADRIEQEIAAILDKPEYEHLRGIVY